MRVIREIVVAACFFGAFLSAAEAEFIQSDLKVHVTESAPQDTPAQDRIAGVVINPTSNFPPVEGIFVALFRHEKRLETATLQDIRSDSSVSFFVGHSNGAVNTLNVGGTNYRVRGPSRVVADFHGAKMEAAWAPIVGGSASYLTIYQNQAILLFIGSKLIANISGPSAEKLRANISSGSGLSTYTLNEDGRLKASGYPLAENTPLGILNTDGAVPCVDKKFKIFSSQTSESGEVKRVSVDQESLLFLTTHQEAGAAGEAKKPIVVALHYNEEQKPEVYSIRPVGKDECIAEMEK